MKCFVTPLLIIVVLFGCYACSKTSFIESKDALLTTSADTLYFDTVFTTTGSITNRFKIFNSNNQKIRLSKVQLAGGVASNFRMNVDGTAGIIFNDIEVEPNDSLYVFVTVSINPNTQNLPFVVQDSILISYNGNERFVQLQAFGQNANFVRGRTIITNTTWNNNLPWVIVGGLAVNAGATLTINEGAKIYVHADAPFIINGTLQVLGKRYDSTRVVFRGDRLDPGFRDYPGSWPGIYFGPASTNNVLTYTEVRNGYQGIISEGNGTGTGTKITLNECIIDNVYDAGIISLNSSITARNCLITNCGSNVALGSGGTYSFTHCTIASYGNFFIEHKKPVLILNNYNGQNQNFPLNAAFKNCIFYGDSAFVKNEISIDRKGTTPFSVTFENVLYRTTEPVTAATFVNSLSNQPPLFDSINQNRRIYNFRLKPNSPAIDKGIITGLLFDLDGKPRGGAAGLPDIGSYEY